MDVVRLRPYLRAMERMGFDDAGMREVEQQILAAPNRHPVIQGLKGVRKARFARQGRGKSGGGRAIFYLMLRLDTLFMLTAYAKNERDELSQEQRKQILAAIESITETRS